MKSKYTLILYAATLCLIMSSCKTLRPYEMLQNDKNYPTTEHEPSKIEYVIQPNDRLNVRVLNNSGEAYFGFGGRNQNYNQNNNLNNNNNNNGGFPVEYDGKVKLPVLGRVTLSGLTIRQVEDTLETMYSEYFPEPFVLVNVNNRKVTVFMNGGTKVNTVMMTKDQFTLIDAIAACGGLTETSRAYRIKLIRGNLTDKPKIYYWNVSSIETLDGTNIYLEANDIIYIESRPQYVSRVLREISPYLTLVTTMMSVYGVVMTFVNWSK